MACHTVCVTEDGRTFTFGRNENGQLGLGDCQNRDAPTLVKGLDGVRIVHVACGKTHTLFLSSGGEVWSVGSNKFGELGLGKTSSQPVDKPQKVSSFASKVVDISAGVEFSAAVTEDGRVFTFGHPEFGVLGHGTDGKYIISTAKEGFREVSTPQHVAAWHVSDSRAKDYLGAAAEPEGAALGSGAARHSVTSTAVPRHSAWRPAAATPALAPARAPPPLLGGRVVVVLSTDHGR